jgi:hypothetical protein
MSRARAGQLFWLHADAPDQEILPFLRGKGFSALIERRQHLALGQLDLSQRFDAERTAVILLSDGRVVGKLDLRIEAACKHSFIGVDHLFTDPHVLELQARQAWPRTNQCRHPVGR